MSLDTVARALREPDTAQPFADLGLKADEYQRIRQILGRRPTSSELAMYSVMWSEHCSYKSSKVHLRLEDVVAYTVDAFRLRGADGAAIDVSCAEDLPPVSGNEAQLREALLQVLKNAQEAVEGRTGARIEVRLDRLDLDERLDNGSLALPEGRFVRVSVRDTGAGIPDEIRENVRQPFFTTKGRQRLGLGLNVVENALRSCGGASHIRSEPGRGTTVDLYFPCCR